MEVANLDDLCNVTFGVRKFGQKSEGVHGSDNPIISITIQLRQHGNDTEEKQNLHGTKW